MPPHSQAAVSFCKTHFGYFVSSEPKADHKFFNRSVIYHISRGQDLDNDCPPLVAFHSGEAEDPPQKRLSEITRGLRTGRFVCKRNREEANGENSVFPYFPMGKAAVPFVLHLTVVNLVSLAEGARVAP